MNATFLARGYTAHDGSSARSREAMACIWLRIRPDAHQCIHRCPHLTAGHSPRFTQSSVADPSATTGCTRRRRTPVHGLYVRKRLSFSRPPSPAHDPAFPWVLVSSLAVATAHVPVLDGTHARRWASSALTSCVFHRQQMSALQGAWRGFASTASADRFVGLRVRSPGRRRDGAVWHRPGCEQGHPRRDDDGAVGEWSYRVVVMMRWSHIGTLLCPFTALSFAYHHPQPPGLESTGTILDWQHPYVAIAFRGLQPIDDGTRGGLFFRPWHADSPPSSSNQPSAST